MVDRITHYLCQLIELLSCNNVIDSNQQRDFYLLLSDGECYRFIAFTNYSGLIMACYGEIRRTIRLSLDHDQTLESHKV